MTVFVVAASDCEGINTYLVCATLQSAERELFKLRDELVGGWKVQLEFVLKEGDQCSAKMYEQMIKNLSSDDYKHWENYPHEVVTISEVTVIE